MMPSPNPKMQQPDRRPPQPMGQAPANQQGSLNQNGQEPAKPDAPVQNAWGAAQGMYGTQPPKAAPPTTNSGYTPSASDVQSNQRGSAANDAASQLKQSLMAGGMSEADAHQKASEQWGQQMGQSPQSQMRYGSLGAGMPQMHLRTTPMPGNTRGQPSYPHDTPYQPPEPPTQPEQPMARTGSALPSGAQSAFLGAFGQGQPSMASSDGGSFQSSQQPTSQLNQMPPPSPDAPQQMPVAAQQSTSGPMAPPPPYQRQNMPQQAQANRRLSPRQA